MGYVNDPRFRRNRIDNTLDFTHIGIGETEICGKGRQIHAPNIANREIENQTLNGARIIGFTGKAYSEYVEDKGRRG